MALRALQEHAPDAATLARGDRISIRALADRIYPRVVDKLTREPVEDFRIDFEDGFGNRPDHEEDGFAQLAANEVAAGLRDDTLPPSIGIRIKPLNDELKRRSLRTFDLFLTRLLDATGGGCRRTSSSRCRRSPRPSRWRRWPRRATRSSTGASCRRAR